ncbi:MAG: hypothetical protein OEL87_02105 [Nanoarchaeota archaeon]|nr:hypothetical protein [Nanoarchaeota archaeon]
MIIKKIFDGDLDESVHISFLKFGRGEYKNKFLIEGKKQAKNWGVKTGTEYVNFLVRRCLEKAGGPVAIKGVIVSTLDLRDEAKFEFKKVSNFQGVRKHVIDGEINPEDIFTLMDKYPKAFFALSFKGDDFVLKVKPKAPTSGKPGKEKDGGPTADFCSLKTGDKSLIDELFFGVGEFAQIRVNHIIKITDIIYPSNMSELKPAEIREQAKRKGEVTRIVDVDGTEKTSEASFVA